MDLTQASSLGARIVIEEPSAYHAVQAVSKSSMDYIFDCPAKFKHVWDCMGRAAEKETDALLHGSLFHAMVLEPDEVTKRYRRKQYNGSTKAGREESAQAKEDRVTLVRPDIWESAQAMADNVNQHPLIRLAKEAQDYATERSLYWDQDGLPCKARLDAMATIPDFGMCVIDLKSTTDASPEHLRKHILDYGYHRQAAWYSGALAHVGISVDAFVFVFCEKEAPYVVTCATVSDEAQIVALEEIRSALETLRKCFATDSWPSYSKEIIDLDLPEWFMKKRSVA